MAISFFALLDDVAHLLDDVAGMVKVATKKTAGVLGDDLALNANQLADFAAKRELPIIWQVSKGSLLNKAILVPLALLFSAFLPQAVPLLLLVGGAYLCFEGVEKLLEKWLHADAKTQHTTNFHTLDPDAQAAVEKERIRAAIRTDFVLSAEIIVIAMGSFVAQPFMTQLLGLTLVALLMTVLVYGVVAIIVKMDDVGLYLSLHFQGIAKRIGQALLWFAPKLLKLLALIGTLAMFIVGGHLWISYAPFLGFLHHTGEGFSTALLGNVYAIIAGLLVGFASLLIVVSYQKLTRVIRKNKA